MLMKKMFRKKKTSRPRKYVRRPARKYVRRAGRRSGVPEYASCSVARTLVATGGGNFVPNTLYTERSIALADFDRASAIAQGYQYFRIKSVKFTFKTFADSYVAGTSTQGRPNLYWLIDKGSITPTNVSLENMKEMGCRPKVCDNRPTSITFRPGVSVDVQNNVSPFSVANKTLISPWLMTNQSAGSASAWTASTISHQGLYWVMEQFQGGNQGTYFVDIEVQFQFKKPLVLTGNAPQAIPAVLAVKNNSPDGIIGGADGL